MATLTHPSRLKAPRRPLSPRERTGARAWARWLTRAGVTPDTVSVASVVFALLASLCLWSTAHSHGWIKLLLFLAAGGGIQLRMLSNMLHGRVVIESSHNNTYREMFHDLSDRIADVAILVTAGYSMPAQSWGRDLGWLAALLAVMTAHIRLLGGSLGAPQYSRGPMAKQHRMAVMTAACVISVAEPVRGHVSIIGLALVIIILGCALTMVRRTLLIVGDLKRR